MRRRLYFLLPNADVAEKVENELLLARIAEAQIHFLAKDEGQLISKKLHVANILQKSDLVHGWQVGLISGGLTGAVLGTVLYSIPEFGSFFGQAIITGCALLGAFLGTWFSGLIAISAPNTQLERFNPALERGEVLLMVDVAKDKVDEISDMITSHHDDVVKEGTDKKIPAFP